MQNPATGKSEPAIRKHIPKGPVTFPQRMADGFRLMVGALRGSGWTTTGEDMRESLAHSDFRNLATAIDGGNDAAAHALVDKYFNKEEHADQLKNSFFRDIAEPTNKDSLFPAPLDADGVTRPPVDLTVARAGNTRKAAEIP